MSAHVPTTYEAAKFAADALTKLARCLADRRGLRIRAEEEGKVILTHVNIGVVLDPVETDFLDAERSRMDKEEPISNPWTREALLESWLQIAIDRRHGVDEDTNLRNAKAMIRELIMAFRIYQDQHPNGTDGIKALHQLQGLMHKAWEKYRC